MPQLAQQLRPGRRRAGVTLEQLEPFLVAAEDRLEAGFGAGAEDERVTRAAQRAVEERDRHEGVNGQEHPEQRTWIRSDG